jgi:hypothetical protein
VVDTLIPDDYADQRGLLNAAAGIDGLKQVKENEEVPFSSRGIYRVKDEVLVCTLIMES